MSHTHHNYSSNRHRFTTIIPPTHKCHRVSSAVKPHAGAITHEWPASARVRARERRVRCVSLVATGGYAKLMAAKLPEITAVVPLLTLEGLRLLWLGRET